MDGTCYLGERVPLLNLTDFNLTARKYRFADWQKEFSTLVMH